MALPNDGVRQVRLRSPETKRWRIYELDAAIQEALAQRLNDLAFLHGAMIVSMCAGHGDSPGGDPKRPALGDEGAFADVRFAIFYPRWDRLAAQQARVCIEALARACAGQDTLVEIIHEPDLDRYPRRPRERRLGRFWVLVRHARPTAEDPELAREWWRRLADRLDGNGPASSAGAEEKRDAGGPLLSVSNHHVETSGEPPRVDGDAPGKYVGYFANEHGEQDIYIFDFESGEAILRMGDAGWQVAHRVVEGKVDGLLLTEAELAWLHACWMATGVMRRRRSGEGARHHPRV